jgi:transcriptional regulator with XRE-family HTH domain
MDFRAWINSTGVSQNKLAKSLGMSPSYLSEILSGKRRINPKLAQRIEDVSKGEVSRMELLYPYDGSIAKPKTLPAPRLFLKRGSPLTPKMRERVLSGKL